VTINSVGEIARDAFYPCGPADTFEVTVTAGGAFVIVTATLLEPWPAKDGGTVLRGSWIDYDTRCVSEPCWLFRLMGDTTERRIKRAKQSLAAWAEREIAKRRRIQRAVAGSKGAA
jgi:hypothetical protein